MPTLDKPFVHGANCESLTERPLGGYLVQFKGNFRVDIISVRRFGKGPVRGEVCVDLAARSLPQCYLVSMRSTNETCADCF